MESTPVVLKIEHTHIYICEFHDFYCITLTENVNFILLYSQQNANGFSLCKLTEG